jgi:hypothetical protein
MAWGYEARGRQDTTGAVALDENKAALGVALAALLWTVFRPARRPSVSEAEAWARSLPPEAFAVEESKQDRTRRAALARAYPGRDVSGCDLTAPDPRVDGDH